MHFSDSETQRLLRDTARSYLAANFDWERLYAIESGEQPLSRGDVQEFAKLGWLGLLTPGDAGGGGASLLDAAAVIEEFGYAAVPAPVAGNNIVASVLAAAPRSPIRDEHLGKLVAGERIYTLAEADRGRSDASAPLAAKDGALSGTLPLVPFAELADFVLTPLTSDGDPALALLPTTDAAHGQVALLDRATHANLTFDGIPLGTSVIATGGRATALRERCDALSTAFAVIEEAGMMQRTLEMTAEYITNRVQFGQPIAKFQAARHRAADLLMQTDTTRWAAYHALWRFELDANDTDEIWLAKHWAVRAADRIYQTSHLLHGGVGVGTEYPLHLFTQGIAAFAVRGGTINEMVDRTIESLGVGAPA